MIPSPAKDPEIATTASSSVLICGCGDVGSRLARLLVAKGWQVAGLRRQVQCLPAGVSAIAGDLRSTQMPPDWPRQSPDYLVFCPAAGAGNDEQQHLSLYVDGLQHCLNWLSQRQQRPKRLLFVSSTGVYGQNDGSWVTEDSPTQPRGFSGRIMAQAEALAANSGLANTLVRLAGIYGPGRAHLLNKARQGAWAVPKPACFTNRIHSEDAAGLLAFLLQADAAGQSLAGCYLGVDDTPAPLHEVLAWLGQQLGVTTRQNAPEQRRGANKRCSNEKARALGWQPHYPSYQQGYAALVAGLGQQAGA